MQTPSTIAPTLIAPIGRPLPFIPQVPGVPLVPQGIAPAEEEEDEEDEDAVDDEDVDEGDDGEEIINPVTGERLVGPIGPALGVGSSDEEEEEEDASGDEEEALPKVGPKIRGTNAKAAPFTQGPGLVGQQFVGVRPQVPTVPQGGTPVLRLL